MTMDRRTFTRTLAAGAGALSLYEWLQAQARRNIRIGHTGITWPWGQLPARGGGAPAPAAAPGAGGRGSADPGLAPTPAVRQVDPTAVEKVFQDVSSQGFHGVELFSWQIDAMEAHGGVGALVAKYKLPLIGSYSGWNMTDAVNRRTHIANMVESAKLVKKYGGTTIVFGPNGVNRSTYVFAEHRANIITALNEAAKAIVDLGLTPVLHPHTGTCIESRDETYAVMENADTRVMKFGPDIGQLQKGGADPVQVMRDFLSIVHHVHLKDFDGGQHFLGYTPLGQGKVDLASVLSMAETRQMNGMVMVELDSSPNMPMTPLETVQVARGYLQGQGVRLGE